MRILVVGLATTDEMSGGSARYLSGLVTALRSAGHEVHVLTSGSTIRARGYSESGIVGQLRRMALRAAVVAPRMVAAVLRRPDVLNVHFVLDGVAPILAARAARVPIVVTLHGPWAEEALATGRRGRIPGSTAARRALERWVYRSAHRLIVLSDAFAEVARERYGVRPERIRVVPGGLDVGRFTAAPDRAAARRLLGLTGAPTVVTVRRLVPRMGLDLAIEALPLVRHDPPPDLVIAGVGPERERLEVLARELGVGDRVRFLGLVAESDLPALYAAGDVCVVPSRALEGFGYVALESFASGTPVVAARVGGLSTLVGGFDPAAVVEPEARAIAEALDRALAEPVDRERCRRYAAGFDWAVIRPLVERVYEEARAARRSG